MAGSRRVQSARSKRTCLAAKAASTSALDKVVFLSTWQVMHQAAVKSTNTGLRSCKRCLHRRLRPRLAMRPTCAADPLAGTAAVALVSKPNCHVALMDSAQAAMEMIVKMVFASTALAQCPRQQAQGQQQKQQAGCAIHPAQMAQHPHQPDHGRRHGEGQKVLERFHPRAGSRQPAAYRQAASWPAGRAAPDPSPRLQTAPETASPAA